MNEQSKSRKAEVGILSQNFVSKWERLIPCSPDNHQRQEGENGPEVAFGVPFVHPPVWSQNQEP